MILMKVHPIETAYEGFRNHEGPLVEDRQHSPAGPKENRYHDTFSRNPLTRAELLDMEDELVRLRMGLRVVLRELKPRDEESTLTGPELDRLITLRDTLNLEIRNLEALLRNVTITSGSFVRTRTIA